MQYNSRITNPRRKTNKKILKYLLFICKSETIQTRGLTTRCKIFSGSKPKETIAFFDLYEIFITDSEKTASRESNYLFSVGIGLII